MRAQMVLELEPPKPLTDAMCMAHGRVRDERGICRLCGRPDIQEKGR